MRIGLEQLSWDQLVQASRTAKREGKCASSHASSSAAIHPCKAALSPPAPVARGRGTINPAAKKTWIALEDFPRQRIR